jgi:hypothetical protein
MDKDNKICVRCKLLKLNEEFPKNRGKLSSWCKKCFYAYRKEKGYGKHYRNLPEYKEKAAIRAREYRKTHKNKEYEKNYREKYIATFKGTVTEILQSARCRAKEKKLLFNLDRRVS